MRAASIVAVVIAGAAMGCGGGSASSTSSSASAASTSSSSASTHGASSAGSTGSSAAATSGHGSSVTSTVAGSSGEASTRGVTSSSTGGSSSGGTSATSATASSSSTAATSGTSSAATSSSTSSGSAVGSTGGSTSGCAAPSGTLYYVNAGASNASDSNPGTAAEPWATIQQLGAVVQAGDTVLVEPGTYAGAIFGWDSPTPGDPLSTITGTASAPIVIEADPTAAPGSVVVGSANGETPIGLDLEPGCDYVDLVGFSMTSDGSITKAGIKVSGSTGNRVLNNTVTGVAGIGGIFVDTSTGVLVQGNTVTQTQGSGDTGHGMYLSGSSSQLQVLDNLITGNAYVGIHINGDISEGGVGYVTGVTIAGNVITGNGQNGINADGLQNSTIANNVIAGNARNGITLYQIDALGGSIDNVIVNNSIDARSGDYAIEVAACAYDNQSSAPTPPDCSSGTMDSSTGNIAFNDVLLGSMGADSVVTSADLALSNNLAAGTPSPWVDADGGNYQLAPGGPGIGAGVATFDGQAAPAASAADIGATSFGLVPGCP